MWEKVNFLYVHEDQEPIPSTTSSQQLCVQLGMCVCSGIGLQALSFHKRLTSFLRPFFTPKRRRSKKDPVTGKRVEIELTGTEKQKQIALKAQKRLMDEGFVVIKIEQANNLHADSFFEGFESLMGSSWAKLAADCLQDDRVACAPSSSAHDHASSKACWFYCGHVNYNNWFLCLMPLKPVGEPNQAGLQRLEVFDRVKPQMSVHTFAEHFDFDVAWNLKMYTIESATCELSLDEMYPNWVLVREYTSFPACQAWRGWAEEERFRKEEQKRTRVKAAGGKKRANAEGTAGASGSKKRRVANQPVSESLQGDQNAVEDDVNPESPVPPLELNDPTNDMNMDINLFDEGASDSEGHASEDSVLSALRGSNGRPASEASLLGEAGEKNSFDLDLDLEPCPGQTHLDTEHPDRPEPASSSSSRVAANTVEPAVPADKATATVPRKSGESTIILSVEDFGELRLNQAQNHIMAVCNNPKHVDSECRKVRTLKPPSSRAQFSNPGQGRPLGLLTSWLVAGYRWNTAEEHKAALAERELNFDRRKKGRAELKKVAGFDQWKGRLAERPKTDGEESEPEIIK